MSRLIHHLVMPVDEMNEEPRALHLVPEGASRCQACGLAKFRMRFYYTDQAAMWQFMCGNAVGMFDATEGLVHRYKACKDEAGFVQ